MVAGSDSLRDQLAYYETVRGELETVLAGVDAATFEWKPVAHAHVKSIGDILRHLCDAEAYWIGRVIEGSDWIRHTREVWNDPEALQERWKLLRRRTLQFANGLAEGRLRDTKVDHRGNIVTVGWILWHIFQHEAHHRGQIYMLLRLRNPDRESLAK